MSSEIEKFKKQINNHWLFTFFLWRKLPAAFWAGVRLAYCDEEKAVATVPFIRMSQNPFGSTYFACLAMAGELSTGALVLLASQGEKISMLVVGLEAVFVKKAVDVTTFTCQNGKEVFAAIEKTKATGEGVTIKMETVGKSEKGEEVAKFWVTWSVKAKKGG